MGASTHGRAAFLRASHSAPSFVRLDYTPPLRYDLKRRAQRVRNLLEHTYVDWAYRYIMFHGKRHPVTMGKKEIEDLAKTGDIRAPFSCNVCEISVKEDQEITEGENLAVVEAMKMQTPLVSQVSGTVVEIHAKLGQSLQPGDKILKVITEVE